MTIRAPAEIGMPVDEIDTPALVIDLDAFERNLVACRTYRRHGVSAGSVRLRPHAKTHKSPDIALRQMALGAVGVCCQKVSEAEAMVAGGVPDVLVSNEVAGAAEAAPARRAWRGTRGSPSASMTPTTCARRPRRREAGVRLDVLVEIDVGARRCGVEPGEAAAGAGGGGRRTQHLRFGGVQSYHGRAQHLRTRTSARRAIGAAVDDDPPHRRRAGAPGPRLRHRRRRRHRHLRVRGGERRLQRAAGGSYIFMDADYARNRDDERRLHQRLPPQPVRAGDGDEQADQDRAVVDAGLKAMSTELGHAERR